MHMVHIGSIFWFAFSESRIIDAESIDADKMSLFKDMHKYLLDHNIYVGPSGYEVGFVSAAHTEADLDKAVQHICDAIDTIF